MCHLLTVELYASSNYGRSSQGGLIMETAITKILKHVNPGNRLVLFFLTHPHVIGLGVRGPPRYGLSGGFSPR